MFENSNNKQEGDTVGKYRISGSTFRRCTANKGGAIYLDDAQYITIQDSYFYYNSALNNTDDTIQGIGGCVQYYCDISTQDCDLTFDGVNTFENNYADVRGGAINWEVMEPNIDETYMDFEGNRAIRYGDNIACYASGLIQLTEEEYYFHLYRIGLYDYGPYRDPPEQEDLPYFSTLLEEEDEEGTRRLFFEKRRMAADDGYEEIQSGGVVPNLYLAHVDKYNQIVGSDFDSRVRVEVDSFYEQTEAAQEYNALLEGQTQYATLGGVVIVKDLQLTGTPTETYGVSFISDGIDTTLPANVEFLAEINAT
jgi:hypothetical protein